MLVFLAASSFHSKRHLCRHRSPLRFALDWLGRQINMRLPLLQTSQGKIDPYKEAAIRTVVAASFPSSTSASISAQLACQHQDVRVGPIIFSYKCTLQKEERRRHTVPTRRCRLVSWS